MKQEVIEIDVVRRTHVHSLSEGWVFVEGHWEPMIVDEDEELIR